MSLFFNAVSVKNVSIIHTIFYTKNFSNSFSLLTLNYYEILTYILKWLAVDISTVFNSKHVFSLTGCHSQIFSVICRFPSRCRRPWLSTSCCSLQILISFVFLLFPQNPILPSIYSVLSIMLRAAFIFSSVCPVSGRFSKTAFLMTCPRKNKLIIRRAWTIVYK